MHREVQALNAFKRQPGYMGAAANPCKTRRFVQLLLQASDQLYITSGEDRRSSNDRQDIIVSTLISHCSGALIDCFSCVNTGN